MLARGRRSGLRRWRHATVAAPSCIHVQPECLYRLSDGENVRESVPATQEDSRGKPREERCAEDSHTVSAEEGRFKKCVRTEQVLSMADTAHGVAGCSRGQCVGGWNRRTVGGVLMQAERPQRPEDEQQQEGEVPPVCIRSHTSSTTSASKYGGRRRKQTERGMPLNARHAREGPMGYEKGKGGHNAAQTLAAPGQQQCLPDLRSFRGGEEETLSA